MEVETWFSSVQRKERRVVVEGTPEKKKKKSNKRSTMEPQEEMFGMNDADMMSIRPKAEQERRESWRVPQVAMSPVSELSTAMESARVGSPVRFVPSSGVSRFNMKSPNKRMIRLVGGGKQDENANNGLSAESSANNSRACSPLTQFEMSPHGSRGPRKGLTLVSPAPTGMESSEVELSLSRSSSYSADSMSDAEPQDSSVGRGSMPMPAPIVNGRHFLSMSANQAVGNTYGSVSDDDLARSGDLMIFKRSLPKVTEEQDDMDMDDDSDNASEEVAIEQVSKETDVVNPMLHRWERSASMVELTCVFPPCPPPAAVPVRVSPNAMMLQSRLSAVSSMPAPAPNAMNHTAVDDGPKFVRSASMSFAQLPSAPIREPRHFLRRELSSSQAAAEKKRGRELPCPDLRKSSSDACTITPMSMSGSFDNSMCVPLPLVVNLKHDGINTISCTTMRDILDGRFSSHYKELFILDCRFDYEYEGGHIKGAIHAHDPEVLVQKFFKRRVEGPVCFIFHCEFSSKRGPSQLKLMRELDRKANQDAYPHLFYPDLFLMENGYCEFFSKFPNYCTPEAYVRMDDESFRDRLRGNFIRGKALKKKQRSAADLLIYESK